MTRQRELVRAENLRRQVKLLRRAARLVPAAGAVIDARIEELRSERARLNPPLGLCVECGVEWDGRAAPPAETGDLCGHAHLREAWNEILESGIVRGADETLDDFLERCKTALRG